MSFNLILLLLIFYTFLYIWSRSILLSIKTGPSFLRLPLLTFERSVLLLHYWQFHLIKTNFSDSCPTQSYVSFHTMTHSTTCSAPIALKKEAYF